MHRSSVVKKIAAALGLSLSLGMISGVPASAAPAAEVARAAAPSAARAGELGIVQVAPARVAAGDSVSFAGTGPASLAGRTVTLQRRVGGDRWVSVATSTPVDAAGAFSASGPAIAPGPNSWRFVADVVTTTQKTVKVKVKAKKKRKGKKKAKPKYVTKVVTATQRTTYTSPEASHQVYQWYAMNEDNSVESSGRGSWSTTTANIGSQRYENAVGLFYTYSTSGSSSIGWNAAYKCVELRADIGIRNDSPTGSRASYFVDVDGAVTQLGQKALGEPTSISIDLTSRLRVKLGAAVVASDGDWDTHPIFANPRMLCSANPFASS